MRNHTIDFIVMAVTKLGNGICVAGIHDKENGYEWIRPTRQENTDWRALHALDLYDDNNELITKVGNAVSWDVVGKMQEVGPHVEDWEHPYSGKKYYLTSLPHNLFLKYVSDYIKPEASRFQAFLAEEISLLVIKPDRIETVNIGNISLGGKFQPRIKFEYQGLKLDYPVTDLVWLKLADDSHKCGGFYNGTHSEFQNTYNATIVYLILGSGQWFKGKHWPFIIGVICSKPLNV